ncbi:vWA domain-containing protein [Polyangium spumosum]|nr:vWA domain-containing protein [Polyangium spumosum]
MSLLVACSQGGGELPPRGTDPSMGGDNGAGGEGEGGGGHGGEGTGGAPILCQEGQKKTCTVQLGEHNGVVSCFKGVHICKNGAWGPCQEDEAALAPGGSASNEKPSAPTSGALADCANNPCDPSCQVFDEDPPGGLKPFSQTPIFSWQTGDVGDYPPDLVEQGIGQPCDEGADCQFNQYCSAPVFGTCNHNKCAVGDPLAYGCDPCVDEICGIDPTCCEATYGGSCAHDYCETGTKLTDGCDPCVTAICDVEPRCCGLKTWGSCSHDYCKTGSSLSKACNSCVTTICEDDPKCCNISSTGTCSHGYCSSGAALEKGCHPCVDKICAADPKCCDDTPGSVACAHDYCSTGSRLNTNCDPCVAAVCTVKPSCCTGNGNAWNSQCVNLVASVCQQNDKCPSPKWSQACEDKVESVCGNSCSSGWKQRCVDKVDTLCGESCDASWTTSCVDKVGSVCGKSCGPFQWDGACVGMVDSVCGAKCYPDPPCSHNKCDSGEKLDPACDACVATICQELPDCCDVAWTNLCVDRVKTLCGEGCPVKGDCVPWLPGQTDPDCAGHDMSIGVPCDGSVPVCNHGNTVVPAGVKILSLPAGSGQFGRCNPNQAVAGAQSCTTPSPIPPGKCINVPAASCNLGGSKRELMVNPPSHGGYTQLPECQCLDNWASFAPNVACGSPSCSNTTTATVKRVNMFVALDRSGSMTTSVGSGETRWTATVKALKKFFKDPGSAGLGVALRFWADNQPVNGCNEISCSATACKAPLVDVGVLSLQSAPADAQEKKLVDALDAKSPGSNTPMYPALDGATQWAIEYKANHPDEEAFVVFATDGDPVGCNESETAISNLAGAAFQDHGVKTYAIGIQGANQSFMNQIASKGGTQKGFFVAPGGNVENELLSALIQIKGDTLSCDFVVPSGGVYDPSAAKVTFTPSAGAPVLLGNVGSAAACGAGWYYDDPANPAQLKLCPSTCQTVLGDTGAKLAVDLGCPGGYDPATFTYEYEADCPPGTKVQWGFLAYDTLTAADTNVVWKARTANAQAALGAATFETLATAQASPDTQVCPMGGPAPCPVSLFDELGAAGARRSHLELSITLNPASNKSAAAIVKSWDITYSCPDSE